MQHAVEEPHKHKTLKNKRAVYHHPTELVNIKKTNYKLLHLYEMQKHKHIKALFFLGVFSMLLLHQVLPHWHHEDEIEHRHSANDHGDTLNHHHHISEKQSPLIEFLDMLLEMHVHSVVSNEILLTHESTFKLLNVKKNICTAISVVHTNSSINYDEAEKIKVYHPPNIYFNPSLSSLDSRGPPSLG